MAYNPQNPNGQATSASSSPVVIASNQSTLPISVATLPLPSGAASETTLSALNAKVTAVNTNAVTIVSNSLISISNSSTANLAANAVFTGTAEDISEYSTIMVTIFADQASAVDGLQILQSSNGVDWDYGDKFTIPANTGKTFSAGVTAKFFRIIYTDGSTATTVFRLQVLFSKAAKKNSSVRPQDGRSNENDFEEVLSYGMVYDAASSNWVRQRGTASGGTSVIQNDITASGSLAALNQTVVLALNGQSAASVQLSGTWVGTVTFEGSNDGTNWTSVNAVADSTSQPQPTTTVNGLYRLTPGGLMQLRANMTAFTSGSATVSMRASVGTGGIFANQILPTKITDGTNTATIKSASTTAVSGDLPLVVTVHPNTAPQPVTGTFFQATQPVSATALPLPAGASTETTLAALNAKVTAVNTGAVSISTALPTGANKIGTVDIATAPATAKGTQGTNALPVQQLKDAGRNQVHYYMVIPVLTTATDTLQTLTGTKSGATVVATTTPAVVTTGKTLRITRMAATYISTATSGYGIVRLRFNTAGVVATTSPIAATFALGSGTPATANATGVEEATMDDGWEFAAGTGIGVSVQGFSAATATAVGYALVSVTGYEY